MFLKFLALILFFIPLMVNAMTTVESYRADDVKTIRPLLDDWNIQLFREYPYLYVYQEESDYNTIFEVDPEAFVLFAERDGEKIGLLEANSLDSPFFANARYTPSAEILEEFKKNGFDPSKILYISCFLMAKPERGNLEAINLLFDRAIEQAECMGKTQICYMGMIEDEKHPLRPNPYIPLEPWNDLGRDFRSMGVVAEMSWPTLQANGKVLEEMHKMKFYVTDIVKA
jgi:hypothetical protein